MSEVTTAARPKSLRERVGQSRLGTVLVLAVTAAVVMGGAYLIQRPGGGDSTAVTPTASADGPAPKIGSPAPDFSGTALDGSKISMSSYKGHPVWLTFGASWCSPCQAEAPDIQAAYLKFKAQGGVVLAIAFSEQAGPALDFAKRIGLTYPQIADPDTTIAAEYRVFSIPSHFFIDKSGILRLVKPGGLSPDQMDAALKEIS